MSTISITPADKDFTLDWMHPAFSEILCTVDSFELRRLNNWGGLKGLKAKINLLKLVATWLWINWFYCQMEILSFVVAI